MIQRPTRATAQCFERVALKILPDVLKWFGDDMSGWKESDILDDLNRVIDSHEDGYALARRLENRGWEADSELVSILDRVSCMIDREVQELLKEWVKANNIQPYFAIGEVVKFNTWTTENNRLKDHVTVSGVILDINLDEAYYLVNSSELGHLNEEQRARHASGAIGQHVAFEKASKA